MSNASSRRECLRNIVLWTGGLLTAGYSATAAGYVANETINIGCIGTGSRILLMLEEVEKVEKPLTHDLSEGRAVIEAQSKHERIVQVGMQQRSMPQLFKGEKISRSGQLRDIHLVDIAAVHGPHLGNLASRSGRVTHWPGSR